MCGFTQTKYNLYDMPFSCECFENRTKPQIIPFLTVILLYGQRKGRVIANGTASYINNMAAILGHGYLKRFTAFLCVYCHLTLWIICG